VIVGKTMPLSHIFLHGAAIAVLLLIAWRLYGRHPEQKVKKRPKYSIGQKVVWFVLYVPLGLLLTIGGIYFTDAISCPWWLVPPLFILVFAVPMGIAAGLLDHFIKPQQRAAEDNDEPEEPQ